MSLSVDVISDVICPWSYSTLLAQFIRDVRKDFSAPKLPFVIGVLGVGGPTSKYGPDQQRYRTFTRTSLTRWPHRPRCPNSKATWPLC